MGYNAAMKAKTKKRKAATSKASAETTGTYVYSRELGAVVKVSDRVPGLSKKAGPGPMPGPACNPGGCGRCA